MPHPCSLRHASLRLIDQRERRADGSKSNRSLSSSIMAAVAGPVAAAAPATAAPSKADAMQVDAAHAPATGEEEDVYTRLKGLQRQLEFLDIQVSFGLRFSLSDRGTRRERRARACRSPLCRAARARSSTVDNLALTHHLPRRPKTPPTQNKNRNPTSRRSTRASSASSSVLKKKSSASSPCPWSSVSFSR